MDFIYSVQVLVVFVIIAHIAIYLRTNRKPLKSIRNRHVVITGGSSGIGFWLAIHCVKLGANVTIIARNVQNLETALKKITLHRTNEKQMIQFVSLDLSKNYAEIEKALDTLQNEVGSIYMLINSAGGAICGRVDEMSVDVAVHMMNINYFATYYPTRYVLTKMKDMGEGIITITGSQASLVGIYGYGAYAAAKFALRGLAETIAMEVSNTNISVTLALPADTDTPGYATENMSKPEETKVISATAGLAKPEHISEKILRDSLNGNFISIYGLESWLLTLICSGMSPWNGFWFAVFQSIVSGPLRFAAFAFQCHFRGVVKKCAEQRKKDAVESTNQDTSKSTDSNEPPTPLPPKTLPATPNAYTFQFNAGPKQPTTTNIFSISPSTSTTTRTRRPMRTATRKLK